MRLSAQEIYDKLLNVDYILELRCSWEYYAGMAARMVRCKRY